MLGKSLKNGLSLEEQIKAKFLEKEEKESNKKEKGKQQFQPYQQHAEYKEEVGQKEGSSFEWPAKFNLEQRQIIGMAIQEAREKMHITQPKLDRLANLPGQYISRAERGEIAKIDKKALSILGHHLRTDFTDIVQSVCVSSFRPVFGNVGASYAKQKEKVRSAPIKVKEYAPALALPAELECLREHSYTLKAEGFVFTLKIDSNEYQLLYSDADNLGQDRTIYIGKKSENDLFLAALNKIIELVEHN